MIGIIIVIIAGFIGYWRSKNDYFNDLEDQVFGTMIGLLIGCIITMLLMLPLTFFTKDSDYKSAGYIEIASLKDKSGIEGNFCLGTGYINTTQYYYAMRKLGKNSYKPITIQADEVRSIDEDDSVEPCIEVLKSTRYNNVFPYVVPFFDKEISCTYQYRFIIPKGTVITKYQVN